MQNLKQAPRRFVAAALRPQNTFAGIRYRLYNWLGPQAAPLSRRVQNMPPPDGNFKEISFTFAVIALSARIACADGKLVRAKYIIFRESFPLRGQLCGKLRSLFALACANATPVEYYLTQIKTMFPGQHVLYVSLVERLAAIATAEGTLSRASERLLAVVAHGLELSPAEYARILARYARYSPQAHTVLGVDKNASETVVKKRYRELIRHYHPDRFATGELSPDLELLLRLKSSEINEAYRHMRSKAA